MADAKAGIPSASVMELTFCHGVTVFWSPAFRRNHYSKFLSQRLRLSIIPSCNQMARTCLTALTTNGLFVRSQARKGCSLSFMNYYPKECNSVLYRLWDDTDAVVSCAIQDDQESCGMVDLGRRNIPAQAPIFRRTFSGTMSC